MSENMIKNSPGQGRKKTPTATLQKRGSWRAKEREKTEPRPHPGAPQCHEQLVGRAKETWDDMVSLLDDAGMLTKIDGKTLTRYCKMWAQWCELTNFDDKNIKIESVQDLAIVHHHLDKTLKLNDAMLKIEVQYGMTPASRSNVKRLDKPAHGNAGEKDKDRFFKAG